MTTATGTGQRRRKKTSTYGDQPERDVEQRPPCGRRPGPPRSGPRPATLMTSMSTIRQAWLHRRSGGWYSSGRGGPRRKARAAPRPSAQAARVVARPLLWSRGPHPRGPMLSAGRRWGTAGGHDHSRRTHQEVRRLHRRRRRQLRLPARTGDRLPRSQRRRQDHHDARDGRPHPGHPGRVTIGGHLYRDIPNPGRHVGVLLDASAQHAGRTGREILDHRRPDHGPARVPGRRDARAGLARRRRRPSAGCATTPSA